MSQSQCGRSASQPGYPLRARWAPARAFPGIPCGVPGVSGISLGFPRLSRRRGQVGHVLLTRSPLYPRPKASYSFDLHVLGAPPAFILSQDQTLRGKPRA